MNAFTCVHISNGSHWFLYNHSSFFFFDRGEFLHYVKIVWKFHISNSKNKILQSNSIGDEVVFLVFAHYNIELWKSGYSLMQIHTQTHTHILNSDFEFRHSVLAND